TVAAFFLVPKKPKHYFIFLLAVLIGFRLAGKKVLDRVATTFADPEERDASAESRIQLWTACSKVMGRWAVFGAAARWFPVVAAEYGFPLGKNAHSLWFQEGAELGFPGLLFLLSFYLLCAGRLWKYRRERPDVDPWLASSARMVISSVIGFMVSAQFVGLE